MSENPFLTRNVRPGAIVFLFRPDENATVLVDRLESQRWWGQIVGPHGTGKSTLLATLIPAIESRGRRPFLIELHDRQRRLSVDLARDKTIDASTVLIVDGYEQLGAISRFRVKRFCRRRAVGLVVTSHKTVGLPTLFRTDGDLKTTRQIVEQLLGKQGLLIGPDDVAKSFDTHAGNVREVLFEMYDIFEKRRK